MNSRGQPRTTEEWFAVLKERDSAVEVEDLLKSKLAAATEQLENARSAFGEHPDSEFDLAERISQLRDEHRNDFHVHTKNIGLKEQLAAAEAVLLDVAAGNFDPISPEMKLSIEGAITEALKRPYVVAPPIVQNELMVPMADVQPLLDALTGEIRVWHQWPGVSADRMQTAHKMAIQALADFTAKHHQPAKGATP